MRVSRATWSWGLAALASVGATGLDAASDAGSEVMIVSDHTGARRVFPSLGDRVVDQASVRLRPVGGDAVDLVPAAGGGHAVVTSGGVAGPADPEAVAGLWSALRMASTVRFVSDPDAVALERGKIEIELPDQTWTLGLGAPSPDGVGVYGGVGDERWVVEAELAVPLSTGPEGWILRRLLPLRPADLSAVTVDGERLAVGADGLWRGQFRGRPILLAAAAIRARLDRLLGARVHQFLEPTTDPGTLWLMAQTGDAEFELRAQEGCAPQQLAVDRGPGRWVCIDAGFREAWALDQLVEPRLAPHEYGRVLSVAMGNRTLRRDGGGWVVETTEGGAPTVESVSEPAVYAWYQALHEATVELDQPPAASPSPRTIRVRTDAGVALDLACTAAEAAQWCQRDRGPWLRVGGPQLRLAPTAEQLRHRKLLSLEAGQVTALELLPGADRRGVRTSVHLDLGVWRLDAPTHPEGSGALDEVRLESLLATLAGLRAVESAAPSGPSIVRIRMERGARHETLELDVHPNCVVTVVTGGGRSARVRPADCTTLIGPLLHDDPLRGLLRRAVRVELEPTDGASERLRLVRDGDGFRGPSAGQRELAGWDELRISALRTGPPPSPPLTRARLVSGEGASWTVERGARWVRLDGADWMYVVQ